MKTLRMYSTGINDRFLDEIVDCLQNGGIIIYPTDTLWAVGCDALNNSAIERLCKFKGFNPQKHTLSIVCDGISMASEYARIDNSAYRILRSNLPGPFTFILPAATSLPKVFKGRKEVGIRVPDNRIALAIAERLGHPVLSSSLKIDDDSADIDSYELAMKFDGIASILVDDGEIDNGCFDVTPEPSTIVDLTDSSSPEILREGKGELK